MIVEKTQGEPEASEMAQKPVVCPIEQIPTYSTRVHACQDGQGACQSSQSKSGWVGIGDSLTKTLLIVQQLHLKLISFKIL